MNKYKENRVTQQSEVQHFDLSVFIGLFQPMMAYEEQTIRASLAASDHVLVVIGSANRARDEKNPWTDQEREGMIRSVFSQEENERISICPVEDRIYDHEEWVELVEQAVNHTIVNDLGYSNLEQPSVALIEAGKSQTPHSQYFPQWPAIKIDTPLGANNIRVCSVYFSNVAEEFLKNCDGHRPGDTPRDQLIPSPVRDFLIDWRKTEDFHYVQKHMDFTRNYQKKFSGLEYPVQFLTVDAVVVWQDYVLLVKRKNFPGKDLWALPGGHLEPDEKVVDGVFRELEEEALHGITIDELHSRLQEVHYFDDPKRSTRGRTVSFAGFVQLDGQKERPQTRAGDDASDAEFVQLSSIDHSKMFEDHADIIHYFVKKYAVEAEITHSNPVSYGFR